MFGGHWGPYASFAPCKVAVACAAEIRNTIARYTWCGDFGDADGFVACFTEDAVLTVKDGRCSRGMRLRRLASGEGSRAPASV